MLTTKFCLAIRRLHTTRPHFIPLTPAQYQRMASFRYGSGCRLGASHTGFGTLVRGWAIHCWRGTQPIEVMLLYETSPDHELDFGSYLAAHASTVSFVLAQANIEIDPYGKAVL